MSASGTAASTSMIRNRRIVALGPVLMLVGCQASMTPGGPSTLGAMVLDRADVVEAEASSPAPAEVAPPPSRVATSAASPPASNGMQKLPPHKSPSPTPSASASSAAPVDAASPEASVDGLVVDLADQPIAGATVRTSDGRTATTDAEGAFSLAGDFPSDGALSASHPDYVASAVAGLASDGALTLHLQPRTEGQDTDLSVEPDRTFQVRGRVVDASGAPAEDVWMTVGDAAGASAVPVQTDAAGAFELTVAAPLPRLSGATLLAAGPGGMAVVSGLNATPSAPFLDFDASDAAVSPLVLQNASRTVAVAVDTSPAGAGASRIVELAGANGVRLSLDASGPTFAWAPQAGLAATLRVEAADGDRGLLSEFVHPLAPSDNLVSDTLLAPPTFQATPALSPDETLRWDAPGGVDGYQLTLSGQQSSGPLWEAFTAGSTLALSIGDALPAGAYTLALTAWQGTGYAPRTVASVGARALRLLPPAASYKRATRTLRLTLP